VNTKTFAKSAANNQDLYRKLLAEKLDHLNLRVKQLIELVLQKYAHVFHDEDKKDFKATNVVEHRIEVNDTTPIRHPHYRTPFALRGQMDSQVKTC
jgi:hypothetical protein